MLRSKQRVVLVEDNPGDAFLAWERLTEAQQATVQVDAVPTLAATLALLALGPVDAIVLNLNLPDSRGLDTLRRVRQAAGQASIIVLTDHVDAALRAQALATGAEAVYDKSDAHHGLFSRSVSVVVERNRARLQHGRLQALLDTLPDAIVIADDEGTVRFANPAAWMLFGQREAGILGARIDFSVTGAEAVALSIRQGEQVRRCEMRVVSVEWQGQAARLASVRAVPGSAQAGQTSSQGPAPGGGDHFGDHFDDHFDDPCVEHASRLKQEILTSLSLQIRAQMHAVSGLSARLERSGLDPLQSCYIHSLQRPDDAFLAALDDVAESVDAAAACTRTAIAPEDLNSVPMALCAQRAQQASSQTSARVP